MTQLEASLEDRKPNESMVKLGWVVNTYFPISDAVYYLFFHIITMKGYLLH